MSSGDKYKQTALFMIVLAIMPLLSGNAFHGLFPGTHGSRSHDGSSACCSHDTVPDSHSSPITEDSCLVCDFLAMPHDIARLVVWTCVLDLVECREPEPVQVFVVLYRPFEPGRAPPTAA